MAILSDRGYFQCLENYHRIIVSYFFVYYICVYVACGFSYPYLFKKKKTLVIQKEMKKVKFIIVLLPKGNMWAVECVSLQYFLADPPIYPQVSLKHLPVMYKILFLYLPCIMSGGSYL